LIYPADWTADPPELIGAVDVHKFLRRHTTDDEPPEPAEPPVDARDLAEKVAALAMHPDQATEHSDEADEASPEPEEAPARAEQPAAIRDGG
jgi:hypothetical protein